MKPEIINEVFVTIAPLLPSGWERVAFHGFVYPKGFDMFFYVKHSGKYIQCFELPKQYEISRAQIMSQFRKISNIVKLEDGREWVGFSFTVTSDLDFKIDFEYTDTEFDIFEWKNKYLK